MRIFLSRIVITRFRCDLSPNQSRIIIFKRHTTFVWRDLVVPESAEPYCHPNTASNHCDDDDEFDKPNLHCISLSACTSLANSGFINRVATFISSLLTEYFDLHAYFKQRYWIFDLPRDGLRRAHWLMVEGCTASNFITPQSRGIGSIRLGRRSLSYRSQVIKPGTP